MLFKTKKNLYININNIKTVQPIPEEDIYEITMIDNDKIVVGGKTGRELIKVMLVSV